MPYEPKRLMPYEIEQGVGLEQRTVEAVVVVLALSGVGLGLMLGEDGPEGVVEEVAPLSGTDRRWRHEEQQLASRCCGRCCLWRQMVEAAGGVAST